MADRTGVPASTLRYYEEIGLLVPAGRTGNGYRAYSDRDVERLQFIIRAKALDLSLDDLRELLSAWDSDDCADVQERMAQVVADRLARTRRRIADLYLLADQLQGVADRLTATPQPGRCGPGCPCSTAPGEQAPPVGAVPIHLLTRCPTA